MTKKKSQAGSSKPAPARAAARAAAARTFPPESPRRAWLVFALAATAATAVFFGSFILHREDMLFGSDMVGEAYPARLFAVQEVEAGRGMPHWNPFVYAGIPYLSILPYPVWYPTSLLYFVMDLHRAIGWAFVLHFLLGGFLAYALARELRMAPGAAAVVGASYMFTGYIVSHLYAGQDGRMFAMQLTPALFLFAERAVARRRAHWFLWLALIAVLQVFSPHVQMMYFATLAVGAYVAFRLVQIGRAERAWKPAAGLAAAFAGAYALVGLITLVEVWPTLNMVAFSHRAARDYAYGSSWAMPVQETLAAIWPDFHGTLESYWGTNPFKLHTEYLGAVPVLLAALALAARRTARVWFFAALGLVALLFAWGGATPVHRVAWWILPMMKSFRAPAMTYSLVALAVVVLAGYGAQALYDRRERLAEARHVAWKIVGGLGAAWILLWMWLAAAPDAFLGFWSGILHGGLDPARQQVALGTMEDLTTGLGVFALCWALGVGVAWAVARGRLAPAIGCAALALLATADLWRVDRAFYATLPVADLAASDPAIDFLRNEPRPYRVLALPDAYGPNDLMVHRVPTVGGLQKFRLLWFDDLVGQDMSGLSNTALWPLLNLRYVASGQPIPVAELALVHQAGGPLVYRWRGPTAGAWLVHETRARPAAGPPAQALVDPSFDPYRVALLEPGAEPPSLGTPAVSARTAGEGVRWRVHEPDRLVLEVTAPAAALLVVSEAYHPYWKATVDGAPAPVLQVDLALRGVPVPAGRHTVILAFADPAVARGAWASAAGLLLWLGLVAATWRRRGAGAPAADA
jgi:hypothetical protein